MRPVPVTLPWFYFGRREHYSSLFTGYVSIIQLSANAWAWLIYSEGYRLSSLLIARFLAVESVVFCRPSLLQLSLYRHLLTSRAVRSCLTSYSFGGSRHLVCIGALKKLCNDPSLIYSQCEEAKEIADSLDMDEVSFVCHFRLSLTFGCYCRNRLKRWDVCPS